VTYSRAGFGQNKSCWRDLLVKLRAQTPFAQLVKVTLGGIFV